MKLWLLGPMGDIEGENPWIPWYDKVFGFVVRAENEEEARKLADAQAGQENFPHWNGVQEHPWLNPQLSMCQPLINEGIAGVILRNYNAA